MPTDEARVETANRSSQVPSRTNNKEALDESQ
jgi:hypothetical protein